MAPAHSVDIYLTQLLQLLIAFNHVLDCSGSTTTGGSGGIRRRCVGSGGILRRRRGIGLLGVPSGLLALPLLERNLCATKLKDFLAGVLNTLCGTCEKIEKTSLRAKHSAL